MFHGVRPCILCSHLVHYMHMAVWLCEEWLKRQGSRVYLFFGLYLWYCVQHLVIGCSIESESGLNCHGTSLSMFTDIPRPAFFSVRSLQCFTYSGTEEFL